jgi:poly(3-hydroxybutyrate) depolymerase
MPTESITLRNAPGARLSDNGIAATYARTPAKAGSAVAQGAATFWSSAITRSATPLDLFDTLNNWWQAASVRKPPSWSAPHKVVRAWPIARLRDFSSPSPRSDVVTDIRQRSLPVGAERSP